MQIYRIKSRYDNKLNAKDLALAKINAGPKMFGFYAYGISLGMDIRDLATIINTPQGRAITKLCEGNVFNHQIGTFSALQAISKLEGNNLLNDLHQFDIPAKVLTSSEDSQLIERNGGVLVGNISKKSAYEVVAALVNEYFAEHMAGNQQVIDSLSFKPNAKGRDGKPDMSLNTDTKDKLSRMVYQIGVIGRMQDCIQYILNSKSWNQLLTDEHGFNKLSNKEDFKASIYQLLEFCEKYGNLVNTYYQTTVERNGKKHYYARDLKILAQGAEEMRVLGSLLSSNKGVKTKIDDGLNFIKTIEEAVINRKDIMGLEASEDDRIDYILFCTDSEYRKQAINKYEKVKHSINILDVIATAPHFLSYIRTCAIPYAAFEMGSAKFKARQKYYDPVNEQINPKKTQDKAKITKGIEDAVSFATFKLWLEENQVKFLLPKGCKMFIGKNQDMQINEADDLYLPLFDTEGNGLATFKYYMEQTVIPQLKKMVGYTSNDFISSLSPFELTKTSTHASVTAYHSNIDMMPKTDFGKVALEQCVSAFNAMYTLAFPGSNTSLHNTIPNYADAFYIYSQYVFGGKKGPSSLMSMFDNTKCNFANSFRAFEAKLDQEHDFKFSIQELIPWCAPDSNIFSPAASYFYATSDNKFGKQLQRTRDKSEIDPEDEMSMSKYENLGESKTSEGVQNYLTPKMEGLELGENIFKIGKNTNIEELNKYPQLSNIKFDSVDPQDSFYLAVNYDSGEYTLLSNGEISERSSKILKLVQENIEGAYINVHNLQDQTYERAIDIDKLKSIIQQAISEVDQTC